jgi:hypothetical protein
MEYCWNDTDKEKVRINCSNGALSTTNLVWSAWNRTQTPPPEDGDYISEPRHAPCSQSTAVISAEWEKLYLDYNLSFFSSKLTENTLRLDYKHQFLVNSYSLL